MQQQWQQTRRDVHLAVFTPGIGLTDYNKPHPLYYMTRPSGIFKWSVHELPWKWTRSYGNGDKYLVLVNRDMVQINTGAQESERAAYLPIVVSIPLLMLPTLVHVIYVSQLDVWRWGEVNVWESRWSARQAQSVSSSESWSARERESHSMSFGYAWRSTGWLMVYW